MSGDICSGMSELIDEIIKSAGDTRIYIMSVLPVTSLGEEIFPSNSEIDKFNSLALSLANEKNICYLDINTELKGMDGKLSSEMTESDGISLKKETYELIAEYILTHTGVVSD
jgi:lysophospholipase L1-like esterase